jgi:hypothetical protein
MSQQDRWQTHPSHAQMPGRNHFPNMGADDSSTFVNPLHEGSSQSFSPYAYSPETAIPPPPPGIDSPRVYQPKRNTGYQVALAVLTLLVVVLGSLEVVQVAAHTLFPIYSSQTTGSNPAGISPAQHTTSLFKTTPVRILTSSTIKEHTMLTCSGCNDPVHTIINSITIDTTNLRLIWTIILNNESGAQQIDYFAEFSLQDPFGNMYEGTGNLNTDFFLDAGQTAMKTEIFSFLPHPGTSYTLITRLGISGRTYDPFQLTF